MWDGKTTYFIPVTDFQMAKMKGRKGCSKAFVAIISRGRDIKMMNEVMALSTSKVLLSKGLQVLRRSIPPASFLLSSILPPTRESVVKNN